MSRSLPLVTARVTRGTWRPSNGRINTTTTMISRTALTLATLLAFGQAQASGPDAPLPPARSALERALDHQLNKYLTFPVMASTDMTGEVTVSFAVNAAGRIEVINATSTNEDLCAYVLRKLGKVDIGSNPDGVWRTSHIRFVFRPEA